MLYLNRMWGVCEMEKRFESTVCLQNKTKLSNTVLAKSMSTVLFTA